ncbi:PIN domain-containing protein [Longimicrobium sp.]|uniref:PIN domain-containing protein n=1 Tax=Longimicrobium sp. TaxID=2029185 RepID=UPI002BF2E252|nr:PIN domain-containing protein [Longimicrobium sp.]HSU14925.1 PIN domain-containing protein [Longimicrobium sp.]
MRRVPRARPRVLLIDTNLFLVLVVGSHDPAHIERFKRTRAYTADDYVLLTTFISGFSRLLVTPNILTEVSNLAGQLAEPLRGEVFASLALLAAQAGERYFPSREAVLESGFTRLGLTDITVLLAAREHVAVLTDDLPLYLKLLENRVFVVNFNHLRDEIRDF